MSQIQITLNKKTMNVHEFGQGPATFILIHGIPGSSETWPPIASQLASLGAKVYVPDLIGFGESYRSDLIQDLEIENQSKFIAELIVEKNLTDVHLVGHDYGGPISIDLYTFMKKRLKSLTILATNTFTDTPIPPPLNFMFLPVVGRFFEKLIFSRPSLAMMLKQGVGRPKVKINSCRAIGDCSQKKAIATIFSLSLKEIEKRYKKVQEALSHISIPTTVIWGTKDPFFPIEQGIRTAEAIPGSKLIKLEGAGHFLPQERSVEIVSVLKQVANIN